MIAVVDEILDASVDLDAVHTAVAQLLLRAHVQRTREG
jgi:hypothetical protein